MKKTKKSEKKPRYELPPRPRGRPPRPDVYRLCSEKAASDGLDVDDLIWGVMKGLIVAGSRGNAKCAALVLKYLGAPLPPSPGEWPLVNVTARDGNVEVSVAGPPTPSPEKLGESLAQLVRLVEAEGSVIVDTEIVVKRDERPPLRVVAETLGTTMDELLS